MKINQSKEYFISIGAAQYEFIVYIQSELSVLTQNELTALFTASTKTSKIVSTGKATNGLCAAKLLTASASTAARAALGSNASHAARVSRSIPRAASSASDITVLVARVLFNDASKFAS